MAANISVIVIGVATALGLQRFSLSLFDGTGWGFMSRILRWSSVQASSVAFLSAGLVMGLIPCGMVYGVLIMAATGGLWLHGAGMMLFFGIGTLPALLAYGQFATSLSAVAGQVFARCMGVAVALLGVIGLMNSLSLMRLITPLKLW
jgi:sulfite exporter TauE/SafE